jgi:hypothetical protein
MASAFARWKGNADQVAPIPGFLKPIDTNAIARQLKLSEKGSERGAEELPHADEDILDGVEQTIIQKIESEWAWQGDALLKTLRAYADRLVGYSVSAKLAELRLVAQDARARFQNASVQADAELGPLKEAFIAARNELRAFRRESHEHHRRQSADQYSVETNGDQRRYDGYAPQRRHFPRTLAFVDGDLRLRARAGRTGSRAM